MKALEMIADAEFIKIKRERISFLQGINYDSLQSKVNQGFSYPDGSLIKLKEELTKLEQKISDMQKQDTVSFPTFDKDIKPLAERFSGIIMDFRQRVKESYENIVDNFLRGFGKAKKQKDIQKTIDLLRELSEQYVLFRELGEFPENNQIQDYHEFHLELNRLEMHTADLISKYKKARTAEDLKELKEKAKEIREEHNAVRKKRSSLFSLHSAFKYENMQFNEVEKELKEIDFQSIVYTKADIEESLAKAGSRLSIINRMKDDLSIEELSWLTAVEESAANQRFSQYRNILFLNELVYQHDEAAEAVKKKASALIKEESRRLEQRYNAAEEKSRQIPQRFEDINEYILSVECLDKELQDISSRFLALRYGQSSSKSGRLIEDNKERVREIKAAEKEYDRIWEIRKLVLSLKKEVEEKGACLERIERLIALNSKPRSAERKISYEGLRKDYNVKVQDLIGLIGSAVNLLTEDIDIQYHEAEKNHSYNLDNVIEQYHQIHKMTDISSRIEKVYALKAKREKEDRESRLKSQIAGLASEKKALEEKNQLTEKQANQYADRIDVLAKQLKESETEKTAYEKQAKVLESETKGYKTQIGDLTTNLRAAKDELTKARSIYKKDDIVGKITSSVKNNNSFVLSEYLRESPEPKSYHLLRLKDILEGRTGERDPFERLNQFSDYLISTGTPKTQEDKEFLAYLFEGLRQDVIKGLLGRMIGVSTYRRIVVNDVLNLTQENLAA